MRAVVVSEFGPPDVLLEEKLAAPSPGAGEVTIEVRFAGVNFAEVMARRGSLAGLTPPFVPGLEASGVVREVGDGVEHLSAGDRVAALTLTGAYAEIVRALAELTHRLPDGIDFETGAALPVVAPTAWGLLHRVARLRAGDSVLVQAAGGGVGTVAGQVARLGGAGRVVGVTGSESKARYAERFGYDQVVRGPDWASQARAARPNGFDIVLDSVGGGVREAGFDLLAPLGRLVVFGNACGEEEPGVSGSVLRAEAKGVAGFSIGSLAGRDPDLVRALTSEAIRLVASGEVELDVTEVLPLAEVGRAHSLLESRQTTGKLLLGVSGS